MELARSWISGGIAGYNTMSTQSQHNTMSTRNAVISTLSQQTFDLTHTKFNTLTTGTFSTRREEIGTGGGTSEPSVSVEETPGNNLTLTANCYQSDNSLCQVQHLQTYGIRGRLNI